MLPIFDGAGARIPHTYNGLTLNTDNFEVNVVQSHTPISQITEGHQMRDGSEAYDVRKPSRVLRIAGRIVPTAKDSTTMGELFDKMKQFAATFDPALLSHNNPATQGFLAYDFSVPTLDTTTYPTGLQPSRYYARPMGLVEPTVSEYLGLAASYELNLLLNDPRRYLQTQSILAGTGTLSNSGDYPSWPTVTITMAGAGLANFSATCGAYTLVLNLTSALVSDIYTVDMEKQTITRTRAGVDSAADALFVSGSYWKIEPGNNGLSAANATNATLSTAWRPAFCL